MAHSYNPSAPTEWWETEIRQYPESSGLASLACTTVNKVEMSNCHLRLFSLLSLCAEAPTHHIYIYTHRHKNEISLINMSSRVMACDINAVWYCVYFNMLGRNHIVVIVPCLLILSQMIIFLQLYNIIHNMATWHAFNVNWHSAHFIRLDNEQSINSGTELQHLPAVTDVA